MNDRYALYALAFSMLFVSAFVLLSFSEVKMPLPSIDEQEKIAETLSAARREIGLLKLLADKYKTQKRGLMQKMLTGEWRIKPEIVNQYREA